MFIQSSYSHVNNLMYMQGVGRGGRFEAPMNKVHKNGCCPAIIADNDSTMYIYCNNDAFMYTLQKMKAMEKMWQ